MTLVEDLRYLLAEIKREQSNPNRLQEYYNSCTRLVPLAEQALSVIERQGRAK